MIVGNGTPELGTEEEFPVDDGACDVLLPDEECEALSATGRVYVKVEAAVEAFAEESVPLMVRV